MTVTDWYLRHLPGWSVSPGSDYHYFSVPPLCLILIAAVTSVPSLEKPSYVSSVQLSRSVVSDSWRPHGLQHARLPCPSPTPSAYSDSCPSRRWCHPTILCQSLHFQSFPASGSFWMNQFFTSGGQSIGVSASAPSYIYTAEESPKSFSSITSLLNGFLFIQELFLRTFDIHRYSFLISLPF